MTFFASSSQPLGNSYAEALQANRVDVLFGVGWTGSALDPYSLMEAYVSKSTMTFFASSVVL